MEVFADRVALVTGSSRGIGRAIAFELARQGASVVVNFVKHAERADNLAAQIREMGRGALVIQADVSRYAEVETMITEIHEELGEIDFLINNAGIHLDYSVKRMPLIDWHRVIGVNLTGAFNCCRCALDSSRGHSRLRLAPSSRIVNITSVLGQIGGAGAANYAASKAGIVGLTKSLAKELAKHRITVNAVAPGYVQTGMGNDLPPKVLKAVLQQIPLGRRAYPAEIAETVAFLCSQSAGYITGSVINVNGGIYT